MTTSARPEVGNGISTRARALLEQRLDALEERIPRLEQDLASWPSDPHTAAALMSARSEEAELRAALAAAGHVYDLDGDPAVVEIGDTVTMRVLRSGKRERFTIVTEPEARFDESWISSASPLGGALLGRRRSDVFDVRSPGGIERYEVVDIRREPEPR